jgi:tetratricopeptide (TPR) repeat protein
VIGFLRLFTALLVTLALASGGRAEDAASTVGKLDASVQGGFARLVFDFPDEASGSGQVVDGVLVISFDKPFDLDASGVAKTLEPYAALVRRDADGKGLRVALKGPVRLKTTNHSVRYAFDLLPPSFRGEPPAVPAPQNASPQRQLAVRVTEREKTTRLQFDFPGAVDHSFRVNGDKLVVTFSKPAKVDLRRFSEDPPPWIRGARSYAERDKLTVEFDIDREADFRDVSGNGEIAVLLKEPKSDASAMAEKTAATGSPRVIVGDEAAQGPPPPKVVAEEITFDRPKRKGAKAGSSVPPELAVNAKANQRDDTALAAKVEAVAKPVAEEGADAAMLQVADPLPDELRPGQSDLSAALAPAPNTSPLVPGVARAQVFGSMLRVELPYVKLPAAAVFRRGLAIWVVTESPVRMDLDALDEVPNAPVRLLSPVTEVAPGVTAFRLAAPASMSVSLSAAGDSWVLAVGNTVPELPERLQVVRQTKDDETVIRIPMPGLTQVLWLKDPEVQDRIAVIMGHAPARGLIDGRRFVDFAALPSRQGIAIQSIADDLSVSIEGNEAVVSRPAGLNVSTAQFIDALKLVTTSSNSQPSPAAAEYLAENVVPNSALYDKISKLIKASSGSPDGMSPQRIALARHYVANGLGPEALGVLRTIVHADKAAEADVGFRVLRALANIEMARYREALADLTIETLGSDAHLALWRGIAAAGNRDWREARNNLVAGLKVMGDYPADWHARGRLGLAMAALELGDASAAKAALENVPGSGLAPAVEAEVKLARALTDHALERQDQALAAFDELASSRFRPVASRAVLEGTLGKLKAEKIALPEAIDTLERLRFQWRGDELELRTLRELAQLYVRENKLREAMGTMRVAVRNFGDSEDARDAAGQMSSMFESFFIGEQGEKLSPLDALSLFYDYKELTPVGVRGDEMIRRLVERLVSVDLLPQAAELLQHQVDNRLEGAAKSAVAVRLSVIYLLDKQPAKALQTIRGTRQTRLPDDLIEQRDLVEARALSDTQDFGRALEVLETHTSDEAEQLRADILWDAQRWPEAAAKAESILGDLYAGEEPLDDLERMTLMRASVAYSLSGDMASLERLRSRFAPKMQDSPDAKAFAMLTSAPDVTSEDYRTLVKRIASVEMLEAFFNEFKSKGAGAPAPETAVN